MQSMTEEDKKLFEKFEEMMKSMPSENEALDFWSKLSVVEYDRLIYLFEQNKIDKMSENIRLKLVVFFKKVKERLAQVECK
ncbi:MAG: hypothetical protein U9N04_00140 [Patescibacteria group bacterium]|nr:hypothetical protein [Patescibacteria group bacterium]